MGLGNHGMTFEMLTNLVNENVSTRRSGANKQVSDSCKGVRMLSGFYEA